MFYQFTDRLDVISEEEINKNILTTGYLTGDELAEVADRFGFSPSTVAACGKANMHFRSGVETYDEYTFTELRVIDKEPDNDDCVALLIKKNLVIVVDVLDNDGSTKRKFMSALTRYQPTAMTTEKLIYAFIDALIAGDNLVIEKEASYLEELEDQLLGNDVDKEYNAYLLAMKKKLLRYHYYYEQILDITQSIIDNDNELFDCSKMMYITNLSRRIERLKEDTDSLKNTVEHLQDAYVSYMDTRLNTSMKILTVITTIFFPLTIIVGWYGMNFTTMPELTWRYGYVYVIILSILVVLALYIIGKFKNWFK